MCFFFVSESKLNPAGLAKWVFSLMSIVAAFLHNRMKLPMGLHTW